MNLSPEPTHYLKTISSPKQIHDHPVNDSPAKSLYSFPHADRFPHRKYDSSCKEAFYDIKESTYKVQRTTSLGKGNKYDFTKNAKDVPGPGTYLITNPLAIGAEKKKGFSFGLSRDTAPQNGIAPFLKNAALNPGPGAYDPKHSKSHQTVSFRIRLDKKTKQNDEVGPGKYIIPPSFEPAKRIFNSKFQSTKSIKFAPLKALVKEKHDNNRASSTGPADKENEGRGGPAMMTYDSKYQINKTGVFFNSKYKNSKCRSFGKAMRDSQKKFSDIPGPGNYLQPSEFGFYESSLAMKQA
jgi:hypothetical protein